MLSLEQRLFLNRLHNYISFDLTQMLVEPFDNPIFLATDKEFNLFLSLLKTDLSLEHQQIIDKVEVIKFSQYSEPEYLPFKQSTDKPEHISLLVSRAIADANKVLEENPDFAKVFSSPAIQMAAAVCAKKRLEKIFGAGFIKDMS